MLKKYFRDLPDPLLSDGTPEDSLQGKFGAALRTLYSPFSSAVSRLPGNALLPCSPQDISAGICFFIPFAGVLVFFPRSRFPV